MPPSARGGEAAAVVRGFASGALTNDEFEDAWPESRDPGVSEIAERVWYLYSDLSEHYYRPTLEDDDLLERCADFLETELPYSWPVPNPLLRLLAMPISLVTLGLANRILWRRYRFPDHWPFPTEEVRKQVRRELELRRAVGPS